MLHALSLNKLVFADVATGKKTFDVRKNDPHFKVNDYVAFNECDNSNEFTGRCIIAKIVYIYEDENYIQPEYCVIGIIPVQMHCNNALYQRDAITGKITNAYFVYNRGLTMMQESR